MTNTDNATQRQLMGCTSMPSTITGSCTVTNLLPGVITGGTISWSGTYGTPADMPATPKTAKDMLDILSNMEAAGWFISKEKELLVIEEQLKLLAMQEDAPKGAETKRSQEYEYEWSQLPYQSAPLQKPNWIDTKDLDRYQAGLNSIAGPGTYINFASCIKTSGI